MADDRVAVADGRVVVHDKRQLSARRPGGVQNVFMPERDFAQFQEGVDLEAIAVVVGDAAQLGIGIQGQHAMVLRWKKRPSVPAPSMNDRLPKATLPRPPEGTLALPRAHTLAATAATTGCQPGGQAVDIWLMTPRRRRRTC